MKSYLTADGQYIRDGEMCYWHSNVPSKGELPSKENIQRGIFSVENRYGELYEIQLGYTSGGYATRYSTWDIQTDVYRNNPYGEKQ